MGIKEVDHLRYKRLFFTVNECFLTGKANLDADINYFIQVPDNINNALEEFYTLVIELSAAESDIWSGIYHRTRTEINSYLTNQHYLHKVLLNPSGNDLKYYVRLLDEFNTLKSIRKAEKFRLSAYLKYGILAISYIIQEDKIVCLNFYRVTKRRAANIYSFNLRHKYSESFSASNFGRAHRALHWLDILEFKKLGVGQYDFCGWYNDKEDKDLLRINQFKELFCNNIVKEYSGVIYNSRIIQLLKQY